MSAPDILGQLAALGLTARSDGERLLVEPKDAITDEVRRLIQINKHAILSALNPVATPSARVELMGLIKAVGTLYAFTPSEFEEATQVALADPQTALTSFREIAKRYGLFIPADYRLTCGECLRLVGGRCGAAKQGLMANTQPDYSPVRDVPRHCDHYRPRYAN